MTEKPGRVDHHYIQIFVENVRENESAHPQTRCSTWPNVFLQQLDVFKPEAGKRSATAHLRC